MAHHKSAEKRLRQTVKRTAINRARDSRVKSAIKSVEGAIAAGKKDGAEAALKAAPADPAERRRQGRAPPEHRRAQDLPPVQAGQSALTHSEEPAATPSCKALPAVVLHVRILGFATHCCGFGVVRILQNRYGLLRCCNALDCHFGSPDVHDSDLLQAQKRERRVIPKRRTGSDPVRNVSLISAIIKIKSKSCHEKSGLARSG